MRIQFIKYNTKFSPSLFRIFLLRAREDRREKRKIERRERGEIGKKLRNKRYEGCYGDSSTSRDLNVPQPNINTVQQCAGYCSKYLNIKKIFIYLI
jgi:hypothetical protein